MKNIYLRGNNWYADFTFHGKRQRFMIGPSRKGAEAVIAKKKAEIAENKFLDVKKGLKPITFHEFGVEYIAWSKANHKNLSYRQNICKLRHLENEFRGKNIQDITTWDVEKWKSRRKETPKIRGTGRLGPSAINGEIRLLKHFFNKAIEWGKCKNNPAKPVKLLKGEKQRTRFLLPDEVQILFSNCTAQLRPIVIVAVNTGMRKSEILGLTWDRVDLKQGIITLLDTKNGERRDVPINKNVRGILSGIEDKEGYIFKKHGKQLKYSGVRKSFEQAVQKSKLEDFRFHDLRHTFASNLVMNGVDLNVVRELLGHKSLEMTLRYSHLSPTHKAKAINVLDQVLNLGMSLDSPQEQVAKNVVSLKR